MTISQCIRLQTLMLADEVRPLTTEERAEFDALWALVEAEEEVKPQ